MSVESDEDLLELDPLCPACGQHHNATDVFDGSERHCYSCDELLVAVEWTDGTMSMRRVREPPIVPVALTGRQRTRRLWQTRGRR